MPKYIFRCQKCNETIEVEHGFDEPHPTTCPKIVSHLVWRADGFTTQGGQPIPKAVPVNKMQVCGGTLERVFTVPNVIYLGSGFYSVDKRLTPVNPLDYNDMED